MVKWNIISQWTWKVNFITFQMTEIFLFHIILYILDMNLVKESIDTYLTAMHAYTNLKLKSKMYFIQTKFFKQNV